MIDVSAHLDAFALSGFGSDVRAPVLVVEVGGTVSIVLVMGAEPLAGAVDVLELLPDGAVDSVALLVEVWATEVEVAGDISPASLAASGDPRVRTSLICISCHRGEAPRAAGMVESIADDGVTAWRDVAYEDWGFAEDESALCAQMMRVVHRTVG